ncbi:unnamed protein product [marine sediment metagenome]|uniref:Uncharacterized protein n=1 Tax=marine sediment metagenome TaxID=412755 RepID=X1T970_9ZZZZ
MHFPPRLFKIDTPWKTPRLIWERGKGWRVEKKQLTIEFPPPILVLEIKKRM